MPFWIRKKNESKVLSSVFNKLLELVEYDMKFQAIPSTGIKSGRNLHIPAKD